MQNNLRIVTLLLALACASCKVSNPGSPFENQPPTTAITSAPQNGSTVNHYLTLRWSGNDVDGEIAGFNMFIDGEQVAFTTRTDSTISFTSPSSGEVVSHTFSVQAVDNEGSSDPNPPQRQFYTRNTAPTCDFSSTNTVRPNSFVGRGFQLRLEASDANRSGIEFSVSIDDTMSWCAWSTDSVFLFADTSLGFFRSGVVALSNSRLTEGSHTIYARCRDSGLAVSPTISRTVNVELDHRPVITGVPARYNYGIASDSLYPDGSIYRSNNAELILAFEADVSTYSGVLNAYRYRESTSAWSSWQDIPELVLTDLPLGSYEYYFQARDAAGAISDSATLVFKLLNQQLSDSILVVDEAREAAGGASDVQIDNFYSAIVEGYNVRHLDLFERGNSPLGTYLSPKDIEFIGLIIWNADERNLIQVQNYRRILGEFMSRGGRVIFSGWDFMSAYTSEPTATYGGSVFEYRFLRVFSCRRDPSTNPNVNAQVNGFTGANGFPSVQIDATKVPVPVWQGALPRTWVFEPRGECVVIGRATTRDPNYFQNGQVLAYVYDLSFRVAVFGVPLYFCRQDQVEDLFDVLLPRMLTGLGS